MSPLGEVGTFQIFYTSITTRVDIINTGLLPLCIPNQLANVCLTYARDIWGERVVTVVSSKESVAYDVEAKPQGFLVTTVKIVVLLFAGTLGMFFRVLSLYNADVRNALRTLPEIVVQEEEEEDYFKFDKSKALIFDSQDLFISYLGMDKNAFQKKIEESEFSSQMEKIQLSVSQSSRVIFFLQSCMCSLVSLLINSRLYPILPISQEHKLFLEMLATLSMPSDNPILSSLYSSVIAKAERFGLGEKIPKKITCPVPENNFMDLLTQIQNLKTEEENLEKLLLEIQSFQTNDEELKGLLLTIQNFLTQRPDDLDKLLKQIQNFQTEDADIKELLLKVQTNLKKFDALMLQLSKSLLEENPNTSATTPPQISTSLPPESPDQTNSEEQELENLLNSCLGEFEELSLD